MNQSKPYCDRQNAIAILGWITVSLGIGYWALGSVLLYDFIWLSSMHPSDTLAKAIVALATVFALVLSIVYLLLGLMAVAAGIGLLKQKQWARWLTYPVAILIVGSGLLFFRSNDLGAITVLLGLLQLCYGPFAFIVLITPGRASHGPSGQCLLPPNDSTIVSPQ